MNKEKSKKIVERRLNCMPAGLGKLTDVVVDKTEGALVWDVDGNRYIDFAGGIGMLNAGHRPKEVVEGLKKQLDKSIHSCLLVATNEPAVELCEMLNKITPGEHKKKTLLCNTGAEAVENAVNIAKYYTKRPAIIVFEGGYHGRSLLTMSMTSKYALFKKGYGSFVSDIYRLPAPNMYRQIPGMNEKDYLNHCINQIDHAFISQVDPSAVAAIVIEPIQGEGGFVPMPKEFLQKIRSVCTQHGILMVADEIQSGFGRTGKMFAIEHSEIVPDIITMAKSIASGFPISAVTGKAEVMDTPHLGALGGTFSGGPLGAVAALETIKIITNPKFIEHSLKIANKMRNILTGWKDKYKCIGDVRGVGGMLLIEIVKDKKLKTPDPDLTLEIIKESVNNGIIIIRAGLFSNCIRLLPPFAITEDQVVEGLTILENSFKSKS